jgi:hypothetical protein
MLPLGFPGLVTFRSSSFPYGLNDEIHTPFRFVVAQLQIIDEPLDAPHLLLFHDFLPSLAQRYV